MIINGKSYEYKNIPILINGTPFALNPISQDDFSLEFYYRRGNVFFFRNKVSRMRLELPMSAINYFKKGSKYNLNIKHEFGDPDSTNGMTELSFPIKQ